eukprot:Platyproteum_vivax@DN9383_c0_g1_i1.p1
MKEAGSQTGTEQVQLPLLPVTFPIEFSLCKPGARGECSEEGWQAGLLTFQHFQATPSLWFHEALMARIDSKFPCYSWRVVYPILASYVVFGQPVTPEMISELVSST